MPGILVVSMLAVWVGAMVVLVNVDLSGQFLWVPILLALAGVFTSVLPLAISPKLATVANGAMLILFIASLEMLKKRRQATPAVVRYRA